MSDGIKVDIQVSGAQQAKSAVDDVANASDRLEQSQETAGKSVGGTADQLDKLAQGAEAAATKQENMSSKASAARGAMEGLRQVVAGGEQAWAGLGKAIDDSMRAVGMSGKWLGAASTIGAVLTVVQVLVAWFGKLREEAEATAERVRAKWEKVQEVLAARRDNQFARTLQAIERAAADAVAEVENLSRARDRLASADMAAELAELEMQTDISPEEKQVRELEIRDRYALQAEERARGLIDAPVQIARERVQSTAAVRDSQDSRRSEIAAQLQKMDDDRAAALAEIEAAKMQIQNAGEDGDVLVGRMRISQAEGRLSELDSPEAQSQRRIMEQQLAFREQAAEEARLVEEEARAALVRAEQEAELERRVQERENQSAAVVRRAGMQSAVRARDTATERAAAEEQGADGRRRIGASDQVVVDRAAKAIAQQLAEVPERAAGGELGRAGSGAADAARIIAEAMGPLQGEATQAEIAAYSEAIATHLQALAGINDQRIKQLAANLQRLERMMGRAVSQSANGRNTP